MFYCCRSHWIFGNIPIPAESPQRCSGACFLADELNLDHGMPPWDAPSIVPHFLLRHCFFFFGVSTKPFRVFPIHLIELCLFCRIVVHTVHTAHHPHTHHLTTVSPHYFETFHNPTFPPTEYHISIHNTLSVFAIFSIIFCDFYYLFFPRYCLGVPWLGPAGGAHGAAARPGGPPHHRHPRHGPRCAPPPGVPLSRDAEPSDRLHRPEGPASLRAEPLRGQGPASIVKMA